jgi:CheY-like chemotaxis protein
VVHRGASLGRPSAFELSPPSFGVSCSGYFHVPDDQTGDLQNRMNRQTSTIHKRRILIVDDDDVLRRWLRNQLEPRGFEVWEESQGDEALSAYERNGPWFFVLSDLYFYRGEKIKNGLGLVRAITVITPAQRMAIHTSDRDFQASVPVLIKPYPIARLLRLLREPLQSLALPVG